MLTVTLTDVVTVTEATEQRRGGRPSESAQRMLGCDAIEPIQNKALRGGYRSRISLTASLTVRCKRSSSGFSWRRANVQIHHDLIDDESDHYRCDRSV